jgi:hypothetical protein
VTEEALTDRWEQIYGTILRDRDVLASPIVGLDKESGWIHRYVVELVDLWRAGRGVSTLLLPGEYRRVAHAYESWLGLDRSAITTCGLGDVDVAWNFEDPPPEELTRYSLVISQAMLEHLIDPYRHMCQLFEMVEEGGALVVLTHTPGFGYHRFPIDALRFFPDWFETVALRLGARVERKIVDDQRIAYQFVRPFSPH